MLAQWILNTAARAFSWGTGATDRRSDPTLLMGRSVKNPEFAKRMVRTRASDRVNEVSWMPGESVQLDAIGYSEEELIAREIKHHREAIALYQDKANGSDAQLRVFARQILPQLQQHLAMLETMKGQHRDVPLGRRS